MTHGLGTLLRRWRNARGKSQFDLSVDTGISQRHISFIESGRSVPSRRSLLLIATGLQVPLRDRNALLLAAGYAPVYADTPLTSPDMRRVNDALLRMLRQQEPFPAVVMDRYWNVIMANEAAPRFFGCFIDMATWRRAARQPPARQRPRNMLHLMFDPAGMRPFIANWDNVARSLIERVSREAVGGVIDDETRELISDLLAYPDVKADGSTRPVAADMPVIALSFVKDGQVLNYFSMITTVGAPQTIAAQELRIESMFPADDATERVHKLMLDVTEQSGGNGLCPLTPSKASL